MKMLQPHGGRCHPDPLSGLRPGPNVFLIFKQVYCALHPGLNLEN